jgi:RNA polymerase sigma factor (sigma-70 family)
MRDSGHVRLATARVGCARIIPTGLGTDRRPAAAPLTRDDHEGAPRFGPFVEPDGTNRKSAGCPMPSRNKSKPSKPAVAESADNREVTLKKKNRSELIRAALLKLSADDRDILDLVYFHENSVEDCALILNLPVATVKTRMLSARKKLADLVQDA